MREGVTSICACEADPLIKVENVPAQVCVVCGEKSISSSTLETLELIKSGRTQFRQESYLIYDFLDAREIVVSPWNTIIPTPLLVTFDQPDVVQSNGTASRGAEDPRMVSGAYG